MTHRTNGYLFRRIAKAADDTHHEKHSLAQDLSAKFRALEDHFFKYVHPCVDVSLAVDQVSQPRQDGDEPNIMTVHGCRHVSDLIASLDQIGTYIAERNPDHALDPEEAYILLCAAHLHDAGNIGGRKNHAERSGVLIEEHKLLFSGTERREQVFDVSRVHGGTDRDYGQDTFRSLSTDNYQRPRLPLLAAILRMGDELSENPERVPENVLEWYNASGESNLAYRYAQTFRTFRLAQDQLFVTLRVYPAQHEYVSTVGNRHTTFWEYLEQRLTKMEVEVRYCSRYGRPYFSVRKIRVLIEYHDHAPPSRSTRRPLTLELDSGYPRESRSLTKRCDELRNCNTLEEYCRGASR